MSEKTIDLSKYAAGKRLRCEEQISLLERGVIYTSTGCDGQYVTLAESSGYAGWRISRFVPVEDEAPEFKAGDRVRTRNVHPTHHTRLPRYARGKVGVIDRDHGVFILPDEHATSGTKVPSHCYAVRFEGRELWGPDAGPRDAV